MWDVTQFIDINMIPNEEYYRSLSIKCLGSVLGKPLLSKSS